MFYMRSYTFQVLPKVEIQIFSSGNYAALCK